MREDYINYNKTPSSRLKQIFILYWSHWQTTGKDDNRHIHPYWQMEFILDGVIDLEIEGDVLNLKPGDTIIIPPMNWHRFKYLEGVKRESWSIKFEAENMNEKLISGIIGIADKNYVLCRLILDNMKQLSKDFESSSAFIECLLSALLEKTYCSQTPVSEPPLIKAIKDIILASDGRKVEVNQVAQKLGLSRDHLTTLVKEQSGMPLKKFLDRERFRKARQMLTYSEANLSEIAYQMGFSDVFAFSHFFKRLSGENPSQFRKKIDKIHRKTSIF